MFFASYGLGDAYAAPTTGWGKAKRVSEAFREADRRGDADEVLAAAARHFGYPIGGSPARDPAAEDEYQGSLAPDEPRTATARTRPETGRSRQPRAGHGPSAGPPIRSVPAEERSGLSVFISYAHEDRRLVQGLADALQARGCRVWIDEGEMRIGDRLLDRIASAIADMDFLLAILSEASVRSPWCRKELSLAMAGELARAQVGVLPVRLGAVSLPTTLRDVYSPRVDPEDIPAIADRLVSDMASHRADRKAMGRPRT